jgi:hypothetical protein
MKPERDVVRPFLELANLGLLKGNGGKIDFAAAQARVFLLVKNGCNFHAEPTCFLTTKLMEVYLLCPMRLTTSIAYVTKEVV